MTPALFTEKARRRAREVAARTGQWAVERGVLPGHTDYRRFVVVCTMRTGSTMLGSYLDSHPNARMFFEVFHHFPDSVAFGRPGYAARSNAPAVVADRNTDPVGFLERHVFTRQPRSVQAVGFKLLYNQARAAPQWWDAPEYDRWWTHLDRDKAPDWGSARSDLWAALAADRDLAVVHLTRENPLASLVSAELAKETGRWGVGATGGAGRETLDTTVRLTPEHCLQDFDAGLRQQREADAHFQGHPVLHVTYEELVRAPKPALARIQTFLGLPVVALETVTKKQNPRSLRNSIENYDDVAAVLRGTLWERCLDERDP